VPRALPVLLALAAAGAVLPAAAQPGADEGSTADYTIRARLDPELHTVDAEETVRLTNRSSRPVTELVFHLYLNAFENDQTLWLRESGGQLRGSWLSDWGYIDVTSMQIGGRSVLATARQDETLLHVPLPSVVPPGQTVDVELAFVARLPSAFARTGWAREFHMVAQWFPKLARLGPDGRFAARGFHASHEFDEDFGTYEVTVDVPGGFVVGATGERVTSERRGGREVHVYRAQAVHDFAWTASPHFVETELRAGPVRVRSLAYPGHEAAVARQLQAVQEALARFGAWLGPYPYPNLTVVSPPEDGLGAGGMEYPTLITTGSRWPAPRGVRFPEEVAIHELGHQWFYGMLASNEPDEAWLDEGLNTYATGQVMETLYGRRGTTVSFLGARVSYGTLSRLARALSPTREPIAQRSADFANLAAYGTHVYYGTDLLLRTLEGRVGKRRLHAALGLYAREWRFRHPTTPDLLAVLERELGAAPVRELVRPVLAGAARVDFAVRELSVDAVREPGGLVRQGGQRTRVDEPAEVSPARHRTSVLVARDGDVVTPVTVAVDFEDGGRVRLRWDGATRHRRFELVTASPAVSATVDPELRVPLDADLTNNARAARGHGGGSAHLWSRLLYAAQTLLQVVGP
jgi:hypothetical protein